MDLIKLLETQLQKKAVGTLTLGKRNSFRELFFEEDQLYVAGEIYSGKIHIDDVLSEQVIGKRLPIDKLETIILNTDLDHHLLPQVLHDQGVIDDAEVQKIAAGHLLEESVDLLYRNSGSFHFQEGRVPEYLMKCEDITVRTPVAIADILAELRRRTELMEGYRLLVPSDEEIFVITEKGLAVKGTSRSNFLLKRLLDLIDGFRNLRLLVQDSRFYEFHVLGTIAKCLEDGHIKKTIHPELKGLATHTFTVADATKYLPYYKNAVKYGVDELAARERLAVVHERLGKVEDAVIQYNFIGDALYRMKKPGKAVKAYQRALSLKPGEILITEKISKIYREAADEEVANGNVEQAANLLESAIRLQPGDREVFRRVLTLLVSKNKLKELSDLCDWIIAYARKTRTPEIGIQTCMEIMRAVPRNSAFRKKLINLYLDFDMKAEATSVMEDLARHYFEKGHVAKAQDLIEKIRRTGVPGAASRDIVKQIEESQPNGRKPIRRDRTARILVIAVLGFCVYQAFTFRAWTDLRNRYAFAEALEASERKAGSLLPDPDESRCSDLSQDLRKFMTFHLISLFRADASKLSLQVEERLAKRRARREERIRVAIEGARKHLQEGRKKEVEEALGMLLELDPNDRFRSEAETMLRKASRFTASAEDLLEKAQSLEVAEDWKGAHRVYCQIVETFPQSVLVKSIRVPVLVTSLPAGAQVRFAREEAESTLLGKTPLILPLTPGQGIEIEVSAPGYQAVKSVIQDFEVHERSFTLLREHAWTLALDGTVEVPPAIDGPWMVLGTSQGVLACVDIARGRTAWIRKGSAIKSLVAPPVLTDNGMYTVWNNGRVVRFGKGPLPAAGATPPTAAEEFFLGSLATSHLHRLDGKPVILIGTKSGGIQAYDSRTASPAWSLAVEGQVAAFANLAGNDVLVTTREGVILRVRPDEPAIVWKRKLNPPELLEAAPTTAGIACLTRNNDLVLLKREDGTTLRTKACPDSASVRLAAGESRVYALEPEGELIAISTDTGEEIARRVLPVKHGTVVPVPRGVVIVAANRNEAFLVDTLAFGSAWSTRFPKEIASVSANDAWIIFFLQDGSIRGVRR